MTDSTEVDLVAFLRARLDEDEAWTRRTAHMMAASDTPAGTTRVLREVEAKRRRLEEYDRQIRLSEDNVRECVEIGRHGWDDRLTNLRTFGWELKGRVAALEFVVKTDALPHSDHPDYRSEWKP